MSTLIARSGWILSGLLGVALTASLAGVVRGGPFEPSDPPSPTMRTLQDIRPSWHRSLSTSGPDPCSTERFLCVGGGSAVLDRQTGLVWERIVSTGLGNVPWTGALDACVGKFRGNRKGWRLPTVSEFRSLIDEAQSSPALPVNHPFDLPTLINASFWTATTDVQENSSTEAWAVSMSNGAASIELKGNSKSHWCVRGGSEFE